MTFQHRPLLVLPVLPPLAKDHHHHNRVHHQLLLDVDRNHRHRVVLGKDTRLSGYMIENAMVAGLTAAGMDVFLLGPIPTPAVAMPPTRSAASAAQK